VATEVPAKGAALRVATLNLWGWFADWPRRRELLRDELPRLEIDVYFLQEVVCGDGRPDQLRELTELLCAGSTARVVAESRPHEVEEEGVAIVSRLPLREVAVWPLPPSEPARHLLETTVDWDGAPLRLATLHAAVSPAEDRDAQIATLARLHDERLLVGADLNAPPATVRPLVGNGYADTLEWDATPTWPLDEAEFLRAWEEKLGKPPSGDVEPRRLDYLLARGLDVERSGTLALGSSERHASDHMLIWADVRP
jgi:endonuclease/exonuclease/phosphatase family metal-dependent hydrolase